jgi:predicted RNA-binding Zn-ribbon protein involved in translation (DUF1610 family)
MIRWLRAAGKVRVGREPDPELLDELFRSTAVQFECPGCGKSGLVARPSAGDDADWPEMRPCTACGRTIAPERLEAIPDATLCAACQQREESGEGPVEVEYCPKCGSPMSLRLSRSPGVSRYVMVCTGNPPCRLR